MIEIIFSNAIQGCSVIKNGFISTENYKMFKSPIVYYKLVQKIASVHILFK